MKTTMYAKGNVRWLCLAMLFSVLLVPVWGQSKQKGKSVIKIGIIADVHDQEQRLQAFIDQAVKEKPDFIIQLGDLSNGKPEINEKMLAVWNSYSGTKYHVFGNHEFDHATKDELVQRQQMPGTYYSFDSGDYHFVVLDCNFILKEGRYVDYANANYYIDNPFRDLINPEQVEWLKKDVMNTDKKVILFSHQTFDDITIRGSNPVPNREWVRKVINEINGNMPDGERKIIACFAGHDHLDHYNQIDGVHYFAVNSALGFKKGLEIKDSLYEFVTLNNKKQTISVKGVKSKFLNSPTAEDYGHYPKELIYPLIHDRKIHY